MPSYFGRLPNSEELGQRLDSWKKRPQCRNRCYRQFGNYRINGDMLKVLDPYPTKIKVVLDARTLGSSPLANRGKRLTIRGARSAAV
jgi:hypothetical protein